MRITENFLSPSYPSKNLDSVASYNLTDETLYLFCTAKESNEILVFDGKSGNLINTFGGTGDSSGKLQRPNGVAVFNNYLIITERDNHRLQIFSLPEFKSIATLEENTLTRPYGIWLKPTMYSNVCHAFVTDQPEEGPGQIFQFELTLSEEMASSKFIKSFGQDLFEYDLESICGDLEFNRLLVAQESDSDPHILHFDLLENKLQGKMGQGIFSADPEGMVLYPTGKKTGYWICTDQRKKKSVFHIFDRASLEYVTSFDGNHTANTDGISISMDPKPPRIFAVDDDARVTSFILPDSFSPAAKPKKIKSYEK